MFAAAVLWTNPDSSVLMLVGVRIGCIAAGVFLVSLLSIIIYPKVASEQVCINVLSTFLQQ